MLDYVRENLPDVLAVTVAFIGWCAVTVGVWLLTSHPAVWFLSAGLLLSGLVGWKFIFFLLLDGFYGTWAAETPSEDEEEAAAGVRY